MSLSYFAGNYNAASFGYGVNPHVQPLSILQGPVNVTVTSPPTALTINLVYGYFTTSDGIVVNNPLNTNAAIAVGSGSNYEVVTPIAVGNSTPELYGTAFVSADFSYPHAGGNVSSATAGLQEAINFCAANGGGKVVVDAYWTSIGGTTAMYNAATIPSGVTLVDNR